MENTKKYLIAEYKSRINSVIDYIENNLEANLRLEELAKVACFSKYHFHRIFYALMGERLFQFIQRVRVEKAASFLINYPKDSITKIALDCGFSDSAVFARGFKKRFGVSASEWRKRYLQQDSNISKKKGNKNKENRNQRKDSWKASLYNLIEDDIKKRRQTMKTKKGKVEVKELPEMTIAYVRHIGPYKEDPELFESLFNKLCRWAGPRGLIKPDAKYIVVYHDDPNVTAEEKLRISVSITVPKDTEVDGEIGKMDISSGKYAVASFELASNEYEAAWNWVYGVWLPQSGFVPDDRPCFELYGHDSKDIECQGKMKVDIYVPVKPF